MISPAAVPHADVPPSSRRPLVVASDPVLLDELLRLCGAAGSPPTVAADPAALRRAWSSASVVLLGAELADVARRLPSRPGVVVVGSAAEPLWQVAADVGADHVAVLPSAAVWLVGLLAAPAPSAGAATPVVCVMGGQGGAGATTLAAALARIASDASRSVLLVDTDPFGGGIDLTLGMEGAGGDRWPQVLGTAGVVDPAFVDRLPGRSGLRLLSIDREEPVGIEAPSLRAVIAEGRRCCDLVVVDLPRSFGPASLVALDAAARVYLVVPAQVRAVAAASRVAADLRDRTGTAAAVVRGPAPGSLPLETVTRSLGIPLAAAMRAEPGLDRDYERGVAPGQPRGPLHRLCLGLLRGLEDIGRPNTTLEGDAAA